MSRSHICGFRVVETMARESPQRIIQVFIDKARNDPRSRDLLKTLAQIGITRQRVSRESIEALAGGSHHQGVIAEVVNVPELDESGLLRLVENRSNLFLCVLENLQDPRNLGACLRTAEAAGVDAVVLSRHDSSGLTPVARSVAAGAAELIPVARVSNIVRALRRLQQEAGIWIVGTDATAQQSLYDVPLTGSIAMAFGSEGSGLKKLTRECCDHLVSIPMTGRVGSLNVSVAVGVGLFEAARQRGAQADGIQP